MSGLARTGDRVEGPDQPAVLRVVRLDAAARAAIAAGEADDQRPVEVQGRCGDREALLPSLRLNRPRDFAGRAIERHELAVEPPDEDVVLADGDALVVPAAADGRDVRIEVGGVLPLPVVVDVR